MIVLILLAFAGMLAGIFLLLNMTPFEFAEDLTKSFASREAPISKKIGQLNHPREAKGIKKTVREAKEMMILTGRGGKFAALCALSLFLAAMGAVICIVIQNYFMLPVLAAGMGLVPFWYVLFTSHSDKKLMNNEIETGLSIITSSYLRSESIITAVEENVRYLNPPVADVFRGFLAETSVISADVRQALANMKAVLAEAGATPADVTKVTVFIVDMADFQAVNSVYSETFGADAPARSCVAVAALPKGARVEIEAIAVL